MSQIKIIAALIGALALAAPAGASAATGPLLKQPVSNATNLSGAAAVAISGHYAYTTAYYTGELTAVDIANPASPVVAGHSATSNDLLNASTVNVSGGYAYVVSKNRNASMSINDDGTGNSLTILDIHTNPATPTIVGARRDPSELFGAYGVAVSGPYAFVAAQGLLNGQPSSPDTGTGSFTVVDVSNPASPTIAAHLDNNALAPTYTNALEHADSVAVSGNYAYVAAQYSNALTVIDISTPTSPRIVASLQDGVNLANAADVTVRGNYAYVANQTPDLAHSNFTVVDVSDPTHPKVTGSVVGAGALSDAYRVRVLGNFAYVSASTAHTMAAIDITDPANPRLAGWLTDSGVLNQTIGLDVDPTGHYVFTASPYLSTETQTNYPPFPQQTGGPSATGTFAPIQLDPNPIGVTIAPGSEPANPASTTSGSFSFSTTDAIASVACKLDSGSFGPCTNATSQQYSGLALGPHTFTVQATDAAGNTSSASYAWTIDAAPANTSPPTISGATVSGSQLTATPGTWTGWPAPMFSYHWQDCAANGSNCHPGSGATGPTGSTYALTGSDVGSAIVVTITATNNSGAVPASSSPTAVVTAAPSAPANTSPPTISGAGIQGQKLTVLNGRWSGTPSPAFAYQWQRCSAAGTSCSRIEGASGPSYVTRMTDVGARLRVLVTATNGTGSAKAVSKTLGPVAGAVGSSQVRLAGISKRQARLTFTLQAAHGVAGIKTIVIRLPMGLSFAKSSNGLATGIVVRGSHGARIKFKFNARHGVLTITLRSAAPRVQVSIAIPAITVGHSLAVLVTKHKLKVLAVSVVTTTSSHETTRLALKLQPS